MMKKIFFLSLLAFTAVLMFSQEPQAEARSHCRSSTSVQLNLGNAYSNNNAYVARRYSRPVVVPPAPIYVSQPCYSPYYGPVYAYPAPMYVEEVYVAPAPAPRPIGLIGLGGLSFSWNFFK